MASTFYHVSIRGASVVREQWRNHGAHVDPVASSLLFINTGFTYPTPRIRTCPEKRSRTKGGEEIRTRIERGRGSIDGKSGRKLYHLSPRINILWDSIRHPFPLQPPVPLCFPLSNPPFQRVSLYDCAYVTVKRWPLESVGLSRRIEVEGGGISGKVFWEMPGKRERIRRSRMGNL